MKFQRGQSGNPAGRPPGARNKKTIAMEEELAERASKAADRIIFLAQGGHPVAMRICAEWARPSGTNRAPALELAPIACSDDAQAALQTVLEAFGSGAITVRELPTVLGGVERAVRVADRIQQMRERERTGRQIRGELHPDMLPRPVPDPMQPIFDAIARGEDPFPEDSTAGASEAAGESLYSPVNSSEEETSSPDAEASPVAAESVAEGDGLYSPVNSSREGTFGPHAEACPVGATPSVAEADGLYFPVYSGANAPEPPPGAADAASGGHG
ncbi:MAG TPA: DUF5681 domain-containing protein [Xanthobacteraceae bacterium]|nr:DUF5681 domain-containing protein [Xanthobacteraceae bacterium]